ncbi:LLM class flavin-dependent oxidoreductase [Jiangella endophytica]|uniref:LLM class flavin-dependent oxidoreductase n=1 Tax=Jiangella endophytica TaxID=1623398 RepID=UPI0013007307|nr:LLM class flavin-dependent oxidoreductase [Jiangella endophytica]
MPTLILNSQYLPSSRDWRSDAGRADTPFDVATFIREAQRAEAAGFDAFFHADFSGVDRTHLRSGPPLSAFEPFQLAALVAAATSRIAVMPTISTLYTHPFTFARNLASLDRISQGRAWVNVVSSFRSGTAIGMRRDVPRGSRHGQTEEFVTVTRRLWESWPPRANVPDLAAGRYIRDDLIIDVGHAGEFYEQAGPIDAPPYSERFPFVLQATSSLEGFRLAARTADAVFVGTPTLGAARQLRRILRAETRRAGRDPGSVTLLPGAFCRVTGSRPGTDTDAPAPRRWHRARPRPDDSTVQRLLAQFPGLRLQGASATDPLPADVLADDPDDVFAELGSRYLPFWDLVQTPGQTVGEFAADALALGEHAYFSGSPEQIGDELRRWYDEEGVDGFQFILGDDFEALCERVVPRLLGR